MDTNDESEFLPGDQIVIERTNDGWKYQTVMKSGGIMSTHDLKAKKLKELLDKIRNAFAED